MNSNQPGEKKMDIGKRIAYYRFKKDLSVNKLATMSGISQSNLRDIELGSKNPTIETLTYICDVLNISLSEFFDDGTQQKFTDEPLIQEIYSLTPKQRSMLLEFIKSMKE